MTIKDIQVKKRNHVPTHGWYNAPSPAAITTPVAVPVPEQPKSYIPSFEELVYDVYDAQRALISGTYPKRTVCSAPVPVKHIERLYQINPSLVDFDGMTYHQAMRKFHDAAIRTGIRNESSIPFIFADRIRVRSHAFAEGYAYIYENRGGMRYQVLATQQEFFWITNNRQILSNLSFFLNQKYNCNLHLASDEADRIFAATGERPMHNRHLFTQACEFYINPRRFDLETFVRCQVKEVRFLEGPQLWEMLNNTDELLTIDPKLYLEIDKAKAIYNGRLIQWVGDFSDEVPAGS